MRFAHFLRNGSAIAAAERGSILISPKPNKKPHTRRGLLFGFGSGNRDIDFMLAPRPKCWTFATVFL
jgi:hypothetical protein